MWNKIIYYLIAVISCGLLFAQGGSVGCGDVVVDQLPFQYVGSTVGAGDNVAIGNEGTGNGEDFIFTLNVSSTVTVDISLCHTETNFNAQMGVYLLNSDCTLNSIGPSSCAYPNTNQGAQVDCFSEDAPACTWSVAPTDVITTSYRPMIFEYELSPIGAGSTPYYIVIDGYQGQTGNFKMTIENSEPPHIDSVSLDEHNQEMLIYFSEPIYNNSQPWFGPTPVTNDDFNLEFIQNNGIGINAQDSIALGGITLRQDNPVTGYWELIGGDQNIWFNLQLFGAFGGVETIEILAVDGNSVFDGGGTPMNVDSTTGIININPDSIRWMNNLGMEPNNLFATVVFSQGAYKNSNGTGGLDTSDLKLEFYYDAGWDSSTGLVMESLKNTSGNPLVGGEDSVRIYVSPIGIPNGHEDWNIHPKDDNSIYEVTGAPMWNGWNTGFTLIDKQPPYIVSVSLTDSNSIYIIVSERLDYGVDKDDFLITLSENGGNAAGLSISDIDNYNGSNDWYYFDTLNIHLEFTDLPSGEETIQLWPKADSVLDRRAYDQLWYLENEERWDYANAMDTNQTTGVLQLFDKLPPEIDSLSSFMPISNAYVAMRISEGIFGNVDGTDALGVSDFEITDFNANGGTADTIAITNVTGPDGATLSGGEDSVWVYLDVTGSPSGVETFSITAGLNEIFDDNKNAMADTMTSGRDTLNRYPRLEVKDVELDANNAFVKLVLSEGVYGDADTSQPITVADLQLLFSSNGGNVSGAVMDSLKKGDGSSALIGGEDTLIVYFTQTNSPAAGSETIEIRAADAGSVYNSIGNAMTTEETTDLIFLHDLLSPTFFSSALTLDTVVTITATEPLYAASDETGALEYSDFTFTFSSNGGNATDANVVLLTNNTWGILNGGEVDILIHFELDDIASGVEQVEITPIHGLAIYDSVGNPMSVSQTTGLLTLQDRYPPSLDSTRSVIVSSNAYVELFASEGLYTNAAGNTPLNAADFAVVFDRNGGNATGADIAQVRKVGGSALSGNEDSLWVYINVTETPNGLERVRIEAEDTDAIYDDNGNELDSLSTSGWVTLNQYPQILENQQVLDGNNESITIVFSNGIYGDAAATVPIELSDLELTFVQNEGNATAAELTSLRKTNGSVLAGGEDSVTVFFTLSNPPASGTETIEIASASDGSVYNSIGNPLTSLETTGLVSLHDKLVPTFAASELTLDTAITITISEGLFTNADGTGSILPADFSVDVEQNNGNASEATITAITNTDGSELSGGESVFLIHFIMDALPSGVEQIEIRPTTDQSVFDASGNAMFMAVSSGEMTLNDLLPPSIRSSSNLTWDNQIELRVTEGLYTSNSGSGGIEISDFELEFNSNNGNAQSVTIGSTTSEWNTALGGGEIIIRLHLDFDKLPSGTETVRAFPTNDNSIFDASGNAMYDTETTTFFLINDKLPPEITSASVGDQDTIPLISGREIEFSLSEPLSSFSLSVDNKYTDSLQYVLDTASAVLRLTLIPPLASLDTFTVTWSNMRDTANVLFDSAVVYTYYTPALGDFDWDEDIDASDLSQLVTSWHESDYDYELGPVTGSLPHYIIQTDAEFGLDDGMAFVHMWYWKNQLNALSRPEREMFGKAASITASDKGITVTPPDSAFTGQLYFEYNSSAVSLHFDKQSAGSSPFVLSERDDISGKLLVEYTEWMGNDIAELAFETHSLGRETGQIKAVYAFFDQHGALISEGTQRFKLSAIPSDFALHPVYPNPFNPTTTIRFDIPNSNQAIVRIQIFDITGRLVDTLVDGNLDPGYYDIVWNGNRQSSGVYFLKLISGDIRKIQKMILLK